MQQKRLPIALLSFLSGLLLCFIADCGNGPKVRVYVSDPASNGMEYYDETTGEKGFVTYDKTDKFIAFSETDAQTLFDYCGLGK